MKQSRHTCSCKDCPSSREPIQKSQCESREASDDKLSGSDTEEQLQSRGIYYIVGDIELGGLKEIQQDILLKHLSPKWQDDIHIFINSPGGVLSETWALVDLLSTVKMDVWTTGIGEICSAGTILLAAGSPGKRRVMSNSGLMIHHFSTGHYDSYPQLVAAAVGDKLEQERNERFWLTHSNLSTVQEVKEKLLTVTDNWLTPSQALSLGIIDEVIEVEIDYKQKKVGNRDVLDPLKQANDKPLPSRKTIRREKHSIVRRKSS